MEMALDIIFLVRVLHVRSELTGVLIAVGSLGGVAGGALTGPITRRIGPARIMWMAPLVIGGALGGLIGVRPSMWIAIIGTWAAGFWVFFLAVAVDAGLSRHGAGFVTQGS